MSMNVIEIPIGDIRPYDNNPRDNDGAVSFVAASIRRFGFRIPIQIDEDNVVLCGHTRLKAALELGMEKVPCIVCGGLTEAEKVAFRMADNKVSEIAKWDFGKLDEELSKVGDEIDMQNFGFVFNEHDIDPLPKDEDDGGDCALIVVLESAEERKDLQERLESEGYSCRIPKR